MPDDWVFVIASDTWHAFSLITYIRDVGHSYSEPRCQQCIYTYIDSAEGHEYQEMESKASASYMKDDNTPPTPCLHE